MRSMISVGCDVFCPLTLNSFTPAGAALLNKTLDGDQLLTTQQVVFISLLEDDLRFRHPLAPAICTAMLTGI